MKAHPAVFISKEGIATFWFFLAAAAVIGSGLYVRGMVVKAGLRPQFIIMTNRDVTAMTPDADPAQQDAVITSQTRLAMDSIFNKSASGLDAPERCKVLLSKEAWKWVDVELVTKQADAFRDGRMHQKVEIESIQIRHQGSGIGTLAVVKGQLIRTGILGDKLFNEVWAVHADLMWTPNDSLRASGRFPVVCSAFNCREASVATTVRRTVVDQTRPAPASGAAAATGGTARP